MRTSVDVRKYGEKYGEEVRKYREAVRQTFREQGKASFEEARKLIRAWIGATDLAYERVLTELKDFDAKARVEKLKDFDAKARVEKLQKQAKGKTVADLRKQAEHTYADLAKRGDKVIRDLRRGPKARLVFRKTEQALKETEKRVEEAEQHVTGRAPRKPATSKAASTK